MSSQLPVRLSSFSRVCIVLTFAVLLRATLCAQNWEPDPTFAPAFESGAAPAPPSLFASPGGKLVVVPRYAINGIAAPFRPVRLNRDGSTDTAFRAPVGPWSVLSVYADERLLVAKTTATSVGVTTEISRLLATGGIDPSFGSISFNDTVAAASAPNGRIVVFGAFTHAGLRASRAIALLNSDGSIASAFRSPFATSARASISSALPLADGRIMIAGDFEDLGPARLRNLARLNPDGSVDSTFNSTGLGLTVPPALLTVADNGTSLLNYGGSLVRVLANGARDTSFTAPSVSSVLVRATTDGAVYFSVQQSGARELRRLNVDGTLDPSFRVTAVATVNYAAALPVVTDDGSLYIASPVTVERETGRQVLSRLRPDGALDAAYSPQVSDEAFGGFQRLVDGKTLAWGLFARVNGVAMASTTSLVRLNADGSLDPAFSYAGASNSITQLLPQPDGKILALGSFNEGGTTRTLMRLLANGTRDTSFTLSPAPFTPVATDAQGFIYYFESEVLTELIRATPDGIVDPTFARRPVSSSARIVPLPDGAVLVVSSTNWQRLRHDGTIDPTFSFSSSALPGTIIGVVPLPDGRVVACSENQISFGTNLRVVRVTPTGAVDFNFVGPNTGSSQFIDYGSVGAVILDLLRDASPVAFASAQASFAGFATSARLHVDTTGRFLLRLSSRSGGDQLFGAYRSTLTSGRNMDLAPTVITQTQAQPRSLGLGGTTIFTATGSGLQPVSYQWMRNGQPIPGATTSTFRILSAVAGDAGDYTVTISNAYGSVATAPVSLTITGATTAGSAKIANISTRGRVGSGEETMIAGFNLTGTAARPILIRAIGPALASFGLNGVLADPKLTLYRGSTPLRVSNDWGSEADASSIADAASQVGAFPLAASGKDAALLVTLEPGSYTAEVSAASGAGGVALVEVYDAGGAGDSVRLTNIATRGRAGSGENLLVAGIVVGGTMPKRVLIRAVGPELANFGLDGVLADPVLSLFSSSALVQSNDDWGRSPTATTYLETENAARSVGAFPLTFASRDATMILTLAPGNYTAQVSGKGGAAGIALVEVYELP